MIAPNTGYAPLNKGHRSTEKGNRFFCRYSIYNNKTDMPIIIDGTAVECAKAMKMTLESFYCTVNRVRIGKIKKYTIITRLLDAPDDDIES